MNQKILITIIILINFTLSKEYGCNIDSNKCNNNGVCTLEGFCICNNDFKGISCQFSILIRH